MGNILASDTIQRYQTIERASYLSNSTRSTSDNYDSGQYMPHRRSESINVPALIPIFAFVVIVLSICVIKSVPRTINSHPASNIPKVIQVLGIEESEKSVNENEVLYVQVERKQAGKASEDLNCYKVWRGSLFAPQPTATAFPPPEG